LRVTSRGLGVVYKRQDLNLRPSVPQTDALTKLRHSPQRLHAGEGFVILAGDEPDRQVRDAAK
jgi:hypothetical protein